ncbi:winged helix-turn-helix domain-containing protein [Mesorhizobium sp.]|nr:winged helix-turn-helix domain-containing protein [Mesorhizobium sp.]RWK67806.1 MAG: adenylate/guanylate cyclase domain-containing protein [Mesorhizobium sp.]RWK78092.1 MAG: adenylate/guanylate cyclase domain-containing protein [Mesorhizobium sp.]RWK80402.1 MAG: adenylate/guanylate cyclase domain-containing protein [Mesorhizobium sp.]RWL03855.1 MAG: adenylate/guanylate cyclase domain-containing protein [Mesorhizobium sp.]
MDSRAGRTFAINGVIVDVAGGFVRDREGREIALRPQAFDLLKYLLENAGRLVTKDELMQAVWPGVFVTDDSLVQCVRDIRRALHDESQSVLKAVPKRGYRLMIAAADPPSAPARWKWTAAAVALGLLVLVVAGTVWVFMGPAIEKRSDTVLPSIAVLPFQAIGGEPSVQRLAGGLTEDIITDLARFPEFRVIAHNSTEVYEGKPANPTEIGAALGVGFVVEGLIQRQADRVRVTAQFIDAKAGKHLWSNRWDRPDRDLFAIQTEIAEQVSNRLGGGAGLIQEAGRITAHRKPPGNLNAYELYLLGTEKLEQLNRADVEEAIRLLSRAIELDPTLARAWVELHHSHSVLASFDVEPEKNRRIAAEAAKRAVALDPADAEAHAVLAKSLVAKGERARAKAEFDAALRMAPNQFEILTFYVPWASSFGEAKRGAEMADHAIHLNPNYPLWSTRMFAHAYFMVGRYDDALLMMDRLAPENYGIWGWTYRPAALAAVGRTEEAKTLFSEALKRFPDLTIEGRVNEPLVYTDADRRRLIETMRIVGFPPCARPELLAKIDKPVRLPECLAN